MIGLLVIILSVAGVLTNQTPSAPAANPYSKPAVPCPPLLTNPGVETVECARNNTRVDCTSAMDEYTIALTLCTAGYFAGNDNVGMKLDVCSRNGSWLNGDVTCKRPIDVEQQEPISTTLVDSEEVQDGELPWNIIIYRQSYVGWIYDSPGTLVTPTHVITSAVCVSEWRGEAYAASSLMLAAGKLNTDYHTVEPNSQLRGVKSVIRHEEYDNSNRVHDIAILVANQSFVLSSHVALACLDWSALITAPSSSDILIGATWRRESKDILFKTERLNLVDPDDCRASAWSLNSITPDKFCARPASADGCHNGPPGSGLMLPHAGCHYLWGLHGVHLTSMYSGVCSINRLNSYTSISHHMAWIRQHLNSTSVTHN